MEGYFFGFVAEPAHAKKSAKRATDEREKPQCFFTDAAAVELGFHLVNADIKKAGNIYQQEVNKQELRWQV